MRLTGEQGWVLLFGLVLAIDFTAQPEQTLSEALHRAKRRHPILVWFAVVATAYHFLVGDHTTLSRYDTYRVPARAVRRNR